MNRWLSTLGAALTCAAALLAQGAGPVAPASLAANDVSFRALASAPFRLHYEKLQSRRFLDATGNFVEVRERLVVRGDGTEESPFQLEFLDARSLAAPLGPTDKTRLAETYRTNAGLLHLHGGFRIRDVAAAEANYTIHDFGLARRAGRDVRRTIVFPRRLDKGIWIVDVDTATGVTLYSAEYDASARLISEIEVTSFVPQQLGVVSSPRSMIRWGWKPRMSLFQCSNVQDASMHMPGVALIDPRISGIVSEYVPKLCQVTENPANGDRTFVLSYTDGVDEFFVTQMPSVNPFRYFPTMSAGPSHTHSIASYNDPGMRVYVFHEGGNLFQVAGRDSLTRLKDVALRVCRQVVTGN